MLLHRLSPLALLALSILSSGSSAASVRGSEEVKNQFTCTLSAFDEDACKSSSDDDGDACVWCAYQTVGFCVSPEQSEAIEEAVPQVTCGDDTVPEMTEEEEVDLEDPYDTTCLLAAPVGSDDAESVCASANDADGDACIWCDVYGGYGVCVNQDQADAVSQFLQCGDSNRPVDPKVA